MPNNFIEADAASRRDLLTFSPVVSVPYLKKPSECGLFRFPLRDIAYENFSNSGVMQQTTLKVIGEQWT